MCKLGEIIPAWIVVWMKRDDVGSKTRGAWVLELQQINYFG